MSLVIGIDPGLLGGVAVIHLGDSKTPGHVIAIAMPTQVKYTGKGEEVNICAVREFIRTQIGSPFTTVPQEQVVLCCIEQVQNRPRIDKKTKQPIKQGATSMFSFGDGFGLIRALPILEGWPRQYPTPQTWQKLVLSGLRKGKGSAKTSALSFVQNRFPGVSLLPTKRSTKPHQGIVDSLCLAEYARRLVDTGLIQQMQ